MQVMMIILIYFLKTTICQIYMMNKTNYKRNPYAKREILKEYTQRRVQPDQCYFTVQITGSNFECSL